MFELIVGIIVIYLIVAFVVNVLPLLVAGGGIVLVVIIAAGALVGFAIAIKNYFDAIRSKVNFSDWEWEKDDEPAMRSYFFGPGYQQLRDTISDAFERNRITVKKNAGKFIAYRIALYVCVNLLGSVITIIFSAIHGTVTTVVMLITYVVFCIVWLIDRVYLLLHRIRSVCPVCKHRVLIPNFVCPQCGEVHKRLVPGPYGILNHTCKCGYSLPATFFNGRSKMDSKCPLCSSALVASDARQIGIQLIGGSKSGKSVLLAALFHQYLDKLKRVKGLNVEITGEYMPYFDELEEWFSGGDVPPTEQMNSQMYPVLLGGKLNTKRQLSVYDIAGEMFDGTTAQNEILQEQFHYCDGLLFVLDPFSDGDLRKNRMSAGGSLGDFSNMKPDEVATNFINYLVSTGKAKTNERCQIPLGVLIVKSDVREVKSAIGPAKIHALVRNGTYTDLMTARDEECRQFLNRIGLELAVSTLEAKFANLHFFPVSAMGHAPDGDAYEPWGVMEVMDWLMPQIDDELDSLIVSSRQ